MPITLSVITSIQAFKECKSKWENFRLHQNDNVMCNSWHWINTWLDIFYRPKDQLRLYMWHCEEKPIGIIPCYLKKTFSGNELRFIATGEPTRSEVCSEFQDFILDEEYSDNILAQFSREILADKHISAIIFDNILTSSKAYHWFNNVNFSGRRKVINNLGKRYLLPLQADIKEQISQLKSSNIKRHAKKFLKNKNCKVSLIENTEELNTFYQELIKEHNQSWYKRGKTGAFEDELFILFHRKFSVKLLNDSRLIAFKLECENEFCALFYGIVDGDTLYYYQSAVNHESKLSSAGVAMHIVAINLAREKGLSSYDLMKGSDDSYKVRYVRGGSAVFTVAALSARYRFFSALSHLYKKTVCYVYTLKGKINEI
mgnify:CR=1 FL=1